MRFIGAALLVCVLAWPVFGFNEDPQAVLDDIADHIKVTYEVVHNPGTGMLTPEQQSICQYGSANNGFKGADWATCHTARITFRLDETYTPQAFANGVGFAIYFSNIRGIIDVLNTDQVRIEQVKGGLYRIVPTETFRFLSDKTELEIEFLSDYWMLFSTDLMPRFYIAVDGLEPAVISNTDTEDLTAYTRGILANHPDNWKRNADDANILMTASTRYDKFHPVKTISKKTVDQMVLPTPVKLQVLKGSADLSGGIRLIGDLAEASKNAAMQRFIQLGIVPTRNHKNSYIIRMSTNKHLLKRFGPEFSKPGGYFLSMGKKQAMVIGYDAAGIFNGLQSIASLVPADMASGNGHIARVNILDAPRYAYRGLQVDVARNFHSKEVILRILDQMAAYKLNKFHFHLSDDEGWRLEIPGLPELTDIGSRRCHDLSEQSCLLPQLGSGPDISTNGSGFYSVQDYIEIVSYAKARQIEVIPEIDMPAHARAAVISMEARYKKYKATGDLDKANEFRLIDPDDTTNYTSVQYYNDSYVNPCRDSTYAFVDKVIGALVDMHEDAGAPLRMFNLGGDEAKNHYKGNGFQDINDPDPVPWRGFVDMSQEHFPYEKSPLCQDLMAKYGLALDELSAYYSIKVSEIAAEHDIDAVAAWSDIYKHIDHASQYSTAVYANAWDTLFWGANGVNNSLLERGFNVLNCHPDFLYFDFPYEVDPSERGYYWGTRYIDTQRIFSFAPQNLPQNAETATDRDGGTWQDNSEGDATLNGGYSGIQAQLWSETIRTDDQLEYMAFPRTLALAERAWHKADWELPYQQGRVFDNTTAHVNQDALAGDWERFANLIGQKELAKIETAGVAYRIPVPGASYIDGEVHLAVPFPGLTAQYMTADGAWHTYDPDNKPDAAVAARITSYDGLRFGRPVAIEQ